MADHSSAIALALELICSIERCSLVAYRDRQGRVRIGYGLERHGGLVPVQMKDITSPPVARAEVQARLEKQILPWLKELPRWRDLGPARQAALLAFAEGLDADPASLRECGPLIELLRTGELNAVSAELRRFTTDAFGRVDAHLAERRSREAALWSREDSTVFKLRATQDTYLKRAPIEARFLSDEGRRFQPKGSEILVQSLEEIPRDGHDWVTSDDRWAIFAPHWEQPNAPSAEPPEEVDWNDFNAPLGQYVTVGEMLRFDARRRPTAGSAAERNLKVLAREFDAMRKAWGGPIMITSGYRPEPINSQVGGVPGSRHASGEAVDVYPADGRLEEFYRWIKKRWSGGLGDGRNRGFIHLDLRDDGGFSARPGVTPAAFWLY